MKRLALLGVLALVACGGEDPKVPRGHSNLPPLVGNAFREEATGDPTKAVDLFVKALDAAGNDPDDPSSVGIAMGALDALVHRNVAALSDVSSTTSLADRIPNGNKLVDDRLAKSLDRADGPFVPGLIAYARLALAERRGDIGTANAMRARTGCAREATLAGPTSFQPVSGIRDASPFDAADIPATVKSPGTFAPSLAPAKVSSFGCMIPLYAQTNQVGVREVAIDVVVPKEGTIGVSLRSPSAAIMRANGKPILERPYAAGAGSIIRFARVDATAGVLRLVVRAGMDQDYESIEVGAWDAAGKPLQTRAAAGRPTATAKSAAPLPPVLTKTPDERIAAALGGLAARDSRYVEGLLFADAQRADTSPELLLIYARAVRTVRDLPYVKITERARAAYDRVLEKWPTAWEPIIEHAVLAGARRGAAEANIESLDDLDKMVTKNKPSSPLIQAYEAAAAGREHLYDRADAAFNRAKKNLDGSALLRDVERAAYERTGKEEVAFECGASPSDRTSLACHNTLLASADRAGAEKELDRLRLLAGTPQLYLSLSTRAAIETGDIPRANKLFDQMNVGDRSLSTLYSLKGKAAIPEIDKLAPTARDAPFALSALRRASGDDPLAPYEGIAEKVTSGDNGPTANAATAVLAHDERYTIEDNGLVHYTLLDVRRVMGTTDVESNAQASGPSLYGRSSERILRRRIFKKDGRILLPDRTPMASQSHADLSQLEAGDAIEAIYEGFTVPGENGDIGLDTPDMLPERTAIRDARIQITMPATLRGSMWSHPMLGKPVETTGNGKKTLVWHLENKPVRRLEGGVPKMDRNANISFSTSTWDQVGSALRETLISLDSEDPEVSAWAHEVGKCSDDKGNKVACGPSEGLVEAVVAASGNAVKEASGMVLADIDLGRSGHHGFTARTSLVTHEGSRTWLVVKALRELGVSTDVVVAENEPFSDSASFPPHYGRFMHPLAVAHVAGKDIWIDADVPGPPLPAGRISPELRGRNVIGVDAKIAPIPALASGAERDEIDERIVVDDQGNAKGSLTVLLRGRSAQDLAEVLVRIVGQERQRALRGIALAWVPFATIEKVELSSSEGSWQVAIRADFSAPSYAALEGNKPPSWILPGIDPVHYVFPRPYVTTLSSTYATHGARENALAINHATQYHVRRRVDLPAKATISRLPGPFEGKGPLLSAVRKISVSGNTIEEDFTLDVTTGTVPREKYDDFVGQVHRTDDAFRASIRVKPSAP